MRFFFPKDKETYITIAILLQPLVAAITFDALNRFTGQQKEKGLKDKEKGKE